MIVPRACGRRAAGTAPPRWGSGAHANSRARLHTIGARDSALAWLAAITAVPSVQTGARIAVDPCFDGLRGDPRLAALVARR